MVYVLSMVYEPVCSNFHRDDETISDTTDKYGRPQLTIRKKGDQFELSVSSFHQLEAVLQHAGAKKMSETRLCLEGMIHFHCKIQFIYHLVITVNCNNNIKV